MPFMHPDEVVSAGQPQPNPNQYHRVSPQFGSRVRAVCWAVSEFECRWLVAQKQQNNTDMEVNCVVKSRQIRRGLSLGTDFRSQNRV